jgi:hypothetical protein
MIEDAELLLEAAHYLHYVIAKGCDVATFEDHAHRVDLYSFLTKTKGDAQKNIQPTRQPAPKAHSRKTTSKDETVQLAKGRIEHRKAREQEIIDLQEPDWAELLKIKQAKAYRGLRIIIDNKPITINTFEDYCFHAEGLSGKSINGYLSFFKTLGDELFLALRKIGMGVRDMRTCCKLTSDQKKALLQIARTGDKAATLAFIQQALPAGE